MKTVLQISTLFLALIILSPKESDAQVKAGLGAAFGSDIEQVGIQGDLHYRFTNRPAFQIGGSLVYYFPEDNFHFLEANLNGAYIFYDEYMFKSYVYTGVNLARSELKYENASGSAIDRAIGLNLGVGAEYDFGSLLAFGDLKYVVGELDQAVFTIGLRLPF